MFTFILHDLIASQLQTADSKCLVPPKSAKFRPSRTEMSQSFPKGQTELVCSMWFLERAGHGAIHQSALVPGQSLLS